METNVVDNKELGQPKPGKIFKKITQIAKKIDAIGKEQKNKQQGYSFRGIDDVYNKLQPLFKAAGVFIVPELKKAETVSFPTKNGGTGFRTNLEMNFYFTADDGSQIVAFMPGEAMDYADKGTNMALSAALKYCLLQMFMIPTSELKDSSANEHTPEAALGLPENMLKEITEKKTIETLTVYWNEHRDLQKNEYFVAAIKTRRGQINSAPVKGKEEVTG